MLTLNKFLLFVSFFLFHMIIICRPLYRGSYFYHKESRQDFWVFYDIVYLKNEIYINEKMQSIYLLWVSKSNTLHDEFGKIVNILLSMISFTVQSIHFYCCKKSVEDIDREYGMFNGSPVHVSVKLTLYDRGIRGISHHNAVNQPT